MAIITQKRLCRSLQQGLNWVLGNSCVICRTPSNLNIPLCRACYRALPWLSRDQQYQSPSHNQQLCGITALYAAFDYAWPITWFVKALKYDKQLAFARLLGLLLYQHAKTWPQADCLIPVPLHRKRLQARGFNQAVLLSRWLKPLKIPIKANAGQRLIHTEPQANLAKSLRRYNLHQAFEVQPTDKKQSCIIIDDVMTTGATVEQFAAALQQAGYQSIQVWTVARSC